MAVDPVKAAIQVVSTSSADDALTAATQSLSQLADALQQLGAEAPRSILHVEAEHVPTPAEDSPLTTSV